MSLSRAGVCYFGGARTGCKGHLFVGEFSSAFSEVESVSGRTCC